MTTLYTFASQTGPIPLSELDFNFSAPITLGSTNVALGGTYTTLAGVTLTNPTFTTPSLGTPTSGTLTNCTGYTYANLSGTIPTWNQNTTGVAANVSGVVAVANGGTGASSSSSARTNLGLGTLSTQDASNVAVTGGSISNTSGNFTSLSATSRNDTGVLATNSGITTRVQIVNTTTPTSTGITLASQTAEAGSVWRIRAYGEFIALSSATARQAAIGLWWGSTQLTANLSATVLTNTGQSSFFQLEYTIVASSATSVWASGTLLNRIGSATLLSLQLGGGISNTVPSGPQTIDLRAWTTTAIVNEGWYFSQVTIERLK
jgi:hypothetical protein